MNAEDIDNPEVDSGPFCCHFSDPGDCAEPCGRCADLCCLHGDGECRRSWCDCKGFVDAALADDATSG